MTSSLAAVLVLVASAAAPASTSPPADRRNELSAGVASLGYSGFFRATSGILTGTLVYHRAFALGPEERTPFRVGGGVRFGQAPQSPTGAIRFPLEFFVTAQLQARLQFGPVSWEPAVGPELGLSGLADLGWGRAALPEDLYILEQERAGPFYLGFTAEVLRFRWSWLTLSAAGFTLATGLSPPGATIRTELSYLRVGVVL